ncbi:MAG: glutamate-1-semialdehyde-2,1-aminomutase [Deltaproteobacteria bacterium HGW-Deltaproteobacteria-10]|nr:MAG: glutamate-1-semialdehyde-2,1-aminomutase [Deltaproteobacteria bacterium HGW-Deltaproteobacteria-10]
MTANKTNHFTDASQVIAGGVNSPVRAWQAVGGDPLFVSRASGSKIYDTTEKEYIDYVLSWGPMILGHAQPDVIASICRTAQKGTSFGAPTDAETNMARLICEAIPSIEQVRMTSSGTEATMTAIRLARGYTGRNMIIKFDGCYHGHADSLLIKAGSGVTTLGIPGSPGIPEELARLTLSLPYNDINALEKVIARHASELAAVIVEPVAGNMGVVLPQNGFLAKLREITAKNGIVLIFDEVITGFRFTFGGYQNLIGIKPDLTCLGKIIGGGMPVGAVGGKREIMARLAPKGDIYQAGTLSGNPLAMSAGAATLNILKTKSDYFSSLTDRANRLAGDAEKLFSRHGVAVCINKIFSMFTVFFQEGPVVDLKSALKSNTDLYARFFHGMLKNGVWLAPSQFEAGFLSFAHTDKDIDQTLTGLANTLKNL